MKILVLMPLDEKWTYIATGLYRALPNDVRDKTFTMPMFMQYCITTKTAQNWAYAVYNAVVAAKHVYEAAEKAQDDLIVIGNCSADLEFDAIFNFQDPDEDLPYEDRYVDKLKLLVKDDEVLSSWLKLHEGSESKMPLHNYAASADFLTAYLDTDPHLEKIRDEYKDKVKLD